MIQSIQSIYVLDTSFRDIALKEQDYSLYEFNKAIQVLEFVESYSLNEGVLNDIMDKLSDGIKKKIEFIKEIAKISGQNLKDLIIFFKNSKVFEIFKIIGFSIKKLYSLLKKGISTYNSIQDIIAQKIHDLGGVQYIKKNLGVLDDFFKEHPVLKKIGGTAVAGLLMYIWLNMSFTPDLEYSMDFKDIILALGGHFSLSDLFASPSGITMLIYLGTGMLLGLSMPWPGGTTRQVLGGFIYSIWKLIKDEKIKIEMPKGISMNKYPKVHFH